MSRKVFVLLLTVLMLFASGCYMGISDLWLSRSVTGVWEGQLELDGNRLIVQGFNGDITVEVWDRPDIDVRINWAARKNLPDFQPVVEINSDYTRIVWDKSVEEINGLSYTISVPAGIELELVSSNGRITLSGQPLAALTARSSNGSVLVTNAGVDELVIRTSNGLVRIENWLGDIDCTTSNGAIHAHLGLVTQQDHKFTTSNGSVNIILDRNSAFSFSASTSNSSINSNLNGRWNTQPTGSNFSGTYNGGGAEIVARTSNSSISVRSR